MPASFVQGFLLSDKAVLVRILQPYFLWHLIKRNDLLRDQFRLLILRSRYTALDVKLRSSVSSSLVFLIIIRKNNDFYCSQQILQLNKSHHLIVLC